MGIVYLVFSFILGCIIYPIFINYMKSINYHQAVSEYSLEEFKQKAKTPTMGGIVFVSVTVVVVIALNFGHLFDQKLMMVLFTFLGYALIGFIDDFIIVIKKNNAGLPAKVKMLLQIILAVIFFFMYQANSVSTIYLPLIDIHIDLKIFYSVFVIFMFVGASNAVNLTDGMDGLAGGTTLLALIPFGIYAYQINEMGIFYFILTLCGALLSYLVFNFKPAKVIMGDVGSLALGGVLAAIAMVLKQEVLLIVTGGIFVIETLCVIIQIGSVKLTGKKVFPYTPIHYTFKLQGHDEKKIVLGFWVVGAILSACASLMVIL